MRRKYLISLLLLCIAQIGLFAQNSFSITYDNEAQKSYVEIGTFTDTTIKGVGVLAITYKNISGKRINVEIIVYDNAGRQIRDFETWTPVAAYSTDFIALTGATRSEVGRVHVKKVSIAK